MGKFKEGSFCLPQGEKLSRSDFFKKLTGKQEELDVFLITDDSHLLYLTGFPGGVGLLLSKNGKRLLYVHPLNYLQAETEVEGFQVQKLNREENFMETVAAQVKKLEIRNLAVDCLTWQDYQKISQTLKETEVKLENDAVWKLRRVKDEGEIKLMRKAAQLTSKGMKAGYRVIKPGVREYEVAAEIEYAMRKHGSWGTAFHTIVASGPRSAFPHGGCTDRKIRKGDLVVVDIGATYRHYRSDMTRTFCAGKPSARQKEIYHIVKRAQEEAFQAVKPQVEAREVDQTAREVIRDAGYGEYFFHGLGHGVGLEAHEPPTLNSESEHRLESGNVVTIEPGIYLRGFGGVRIEDTILVGSGKPEKLTRGPYTLKTEQ